MEGFGKGCCGAERREHSRMEIIIGWSGDIYLYIGHYL